MRLGDSGAAPGFLLLSLLSLQGWTLAVLPGRTDGRVLVVAEHRLYGSVEMEGASVAALACDVVLVCSVLADRRPRH